ncbi:MAG: hypothetical protein AAGA55_00825 [Planctomycetota bacterium]
MSERACYIQRSDRGVQIRSATLIGQRSTERWEAQPGPDPLTADQAVRDTAAWIRERLSETRSARKLDTLCLDVDGAACTWVRSHEAEAELIRSAIDQAGTEIDEDDLEGSVDGTGIAERLPALGRELDLDVLEDAAGGGRTAVLAAPDAPARLLLDRLDAVGVRVERVTTLWHAMAEAWDPGARDSGGKGNADIVSADHPPAAVVLIDAEAGRLVWSWSRHGRLVACGSMRVRRPDPDANSIPRAEILDHDIARLAGDWLGWAAQIGVSPSRLVVVGDPSPEGMSSGEIGRALTRVWAGSLADLIPAEDPIGETLSRTLDARPINSFTPLATRPTRSHRSAYRWAAAALLIAAAGVGALAAGLIARSGDTRELVTQVRQERMDALNNVAPELVLDPFPVDRLNDRITALQRRTQALDVTAPPPIMAELETISFVLAAPGISVDLIEVLDTLVVIKVRVSDLTDGEQLNQALLSIGGSQVRWSEPSYNSRRNDEIEVTYTALWSDRTEGGS